MSLFAAVADLPLTIESYALEVNRRRVSDEYERLATTVRLHGRGQEGQGEDVTYSADDQLHQESAGAVLPLAGTGTLRSFSEQLAGLDLFHGREPESPAYREYRTWAFESAALDLALRQSETSLHEVLGRQPQPVRFVVSLRLGDPPSLDPVLERVAAYPGTRFKLDPEPNWSQPFIAELAASGAVDVLDFKGLYKGTIVDVETDPVLYRRCAEAFPMAWLEDPDLTNEAAAAALEPHRDRVTWDANIHSVEDVLSLPFEPKTLNCKPSRFGSIKRLFDFYDHCEASGIALYGGGQSELGVGRGQLQVLASLFHPGTSNDIAPAGWDHAVWDRAELPVSPLDPDPAPVGFRRRAVA
jgi:L-alanine-DL-glutamate epimerase-like enolase superfamily enzyme